MKAFVHNALVSIITFVLAAWFGTSASQVQTGVDQTPDEAAPVSSPVPSSPSPASSAFPWPNQFRQGGAAFTVYPPELDRWEGERLEARAAVSVQREGAPKPEFGVIWLSARTQPGSATGELSVRDIAVSHASFPTATERTESYLDALRQHLSALTWNVTRERLQSDLAIERATQEVQSQPLRNSPPRILYSESPAILVPIDGTPHWKDMVGLDLQRVVNTRALILQDKQGGRYFLFVAGHWMEAPAIEGLWPEARVRPAALEEAKQQAVANGLVDLAEGAEPRNGRLPLVFVSTGPAELVQTAGPPQYAPIQGTQLLYVTNSPNRVFLDLRTQQHYVLLAGRWYRADSLSVGSWEYVPGTSLPADFAMIPEHHPTESVRASVSGTAQAQEAVIANSVPQVATVKRAAAKLEITYDGQPQLRPIEGTTLQYAVNSPLPVIRVDANAFYALDNGVWFVASSAFGPWSVATSVPPVIYTIPRSSPLHYITYVRVYEATPEVVYEGYTPGYAGSYVAPDNNTVVYGTGWNYQPWVGSVWYPPPVTFGFGFSVFNTWWNPWPWQPWWWAGGPFFWFQPWWGPWVSPVFFRAGVPVAVNRVVVVNNINANQVVNNVNANRVVNNINANQVANNVNANQAGVTNVFQRWGEKVATPLGAPGGLASGSRTATPSSSVSSQPVDKSGAGALPAQTAMAAPAPSHHSPGLGNGAAALQPGKNTTAAASITPSQAARPTAGSAPGGNPNLQVFRYMDGQWQRFVGNGQWQNVKAPPPDVPNEMTKSPMLAQGNGPTHSAGPTAAAPNVSSAPTHGSSRATVRPPIATSAPNAVTAPQSNPSSAQARQAPGRSIGVNPAQGWSGGAASSFGRSGGGSAGSLQHPPGGRVRGGRGGHMAASSHR